MVDLNAARVRVLALWHVPCSRLLKCESKIDDPLTEEFYWGWVFHFTPSNAGEVSTDEKPILVACLRDTGDSIVVGTKGVADALDYLLGRTIRD